ncbi:MAG: NAD(P)-dependent oxidoreductase [Candidatus Competibacteraceae bacterium]
MKKLQYKLMALSTLWRGFLARLSPRPRRTPPKDTSPHIILLTGAAGRVATLIRPLLAQTYPLMRLSDCRPVTDLAVNEEFQRADLTDPHAVQRAVAGVKGIVHLGALADESEFDRLFAVNMAGTVNLFEAARRHGVSRIVFASTLHVLGFYERDKPLSPDSPPRPDSRYAISKLFGENLGRLYADKYGLRVCCLRIGHAMATRDRAVPGIWIGPLDLVALIRIGLEHPELHYEIFHAVAEYTGIDLGQDRARDVYGWICREPGGDYATAQAGITRWFPDDPIAQRVRGGEFASSTWESMRG